MVKGTLDDLTARQTNHLSSCRSQATQAAGLQVWPMPYSANSSTGPCGPPFSQAAASSSGRRRRSKKARLRQDAGGLHIATSSIEYYLKWAGIAQILIEPDGLVFSHGNLFFFVPNDAFSTLSERDGLASEVFAKLGKEAQDRSVAHLPPAVVASARGV